MPKDQHSDLEVSDEERNFFMSHARRMNGQEATPSAAPQASNGLNDAFREAHEDGDMAILKVRSLAFLARRTVHELPGVSDELQAIAILMECIDQAVLEIDAAHERAWQAQGGKNDIALSDLATAKTANEPT